MKKPEEQQYEAEWVALEKVLDALNELDEAQRTRILGAAAVFFDLGGELTGKARR